MYIELEKNQLLKGYFKPSVIFSSQSQVANLYQQLFDNNHHGMIITDQETKILAYNRYFQKQMGVDENELIGEKTSIFNAGKHSPDFYQNMWGSINEFGHWTGTILNKHPSGEICPHELTVQKITVSNGKTFYLGFTVDLTKQLSRVADQELGGIDLLTKLPTKRISQAAENVLPKIRAPFRKNSTDD